MDVSAVSSGKNAKEARDERLRDAKIEEQVLKSMNNIPSIEEKFQSLLKKYVELEKDNKKTNTLLKQGEKRFEIMLREKDNLQKEQNKGILMRDKLEQVCREQQKLIKSVKNESMTKIREEEERRKENQVKFQHSINEISVTLNKNNDENLKLKDDNNEMRNKIKFLAEQYHVCEKQLEKMNEQILIESQLHDAKLAKIQMEATIEKEIILREKQSALSELLTCKKAIQEIQRREDILKEQLSMYTSKYDDFQTSLQKSNDIFTTYKSEIDKMTKKTKKLEKESIDWKKKWEKSNSSLLDLASEKQVRDDYIAKNARQMYQLQKLLRTLQAERTTLYQVLKDNNIERPPMPVLPPEPAPVSLPPPIKSSQPDKMEIMAKSCAELKETLANLQGQMNAITNKQTKEIQQTTETIESKKPNKNKKSKSKNKSATTKGRPQQPEEVDDVTDKIDEGLTEGKPQQPEEVDGVADKIDEGLTEGKPQQPELVDDVTDKVDEGLTEGQPQQLKLVDDVTEKVDEGLTKGEPQQAEVVDDVTDKVDEGLTKGQPQQAEEVNDVTEKKDEGLVPDAVIKKTEENLVPNITNSDLPLPSNVTESDLKQLDSAFIESKEEEVTIKCTTDEKCLIVADENAKLPENQSADSISEAGRATDSANLEINSVPVQTLD